MNQPLVLIVACIALGAIAAFMGTARYRQVRAFADSVVQQLSGRSRIVRGRSSLTNATVSGDLAGRRVRVTLDCQEGPSLLQIRLDCHAPGCFLLGKGDGPESWAFQLPDYEVREAVRRLVQTHGVQVQLDAVRSAPERLRLVYSPVKGLMRAPRNLNEVVTEAEALARLLERPAEARGSTDP